MKKRDKQTKRGALLQANPAPAAEPAQSGGSFYAELLEFAVSLANKLQACGAETYRVEDTITRIVKAYGVERVDAFVIPNSIMASLETDDGQILTKIRRLMGSDTVLDGIERYSTLCRRICTERPDMATARKLLRETEGSVCRYNLFVYYLSTFLIGFGFGAFFGGGILEMLAAGLCGLAIGASQKFMGAGTRTSP